MPQAARDRSDSLVHAAPDEGEGRLSRGRPRGGTFAAASILLLTLAPAGPPAEEPARPDPSEALERQIRYLESQLRELEQEASSLGRDLDLLGTREALSRRRHLKAEAEREEVSRLLEAETAEAARLERSVERSRAQAAAALREIYKRSALEGYASILSVEDPRDVMRAFQHLDVASRRQRDAIRSYEARRREAEERRALFAARRSELESAVTAAADEERRLGEAREQRLSLLTRVEEERALHREASAELRRAAGELEAMLERMPPGSALPALAVEIEKLKGTLPWPVEGRVAQRFGERRHPRFGTVTPHPGWEIRVAPGLPVTAIAAGTVAYSHRFGVYGRMVVIDHGGRYLSVYAKLGAALVEVGDALLPGREVGFAGEPDSSGNSSVYFEIRYQGRALDPADWLRRTPREAP